MSVEVNNISNYGENGGPIISGIATVNTTGHIRVPNGTEAQRVGVESGSLRFNTDYNVVEFYNGTEWLGIYERDGVNINSRGVFGGGSSTPSAESGIIDYIEIATTGNAIDFGDLYDGQTNSACSSSTRGVWGGGFISPSNFYLDTIHYVTILSEGNSIDFGNLTNSRRNLAACSNSTRGLFGGGDKTPGVTAQNTIDTILIATTGNATDFGDLSANRTFIQALADTTTALFAGGSGTVAVSRQIDSTTIASTGTVADFGDLTAQSGGQGGGCSSSTRGLFMGGGRSTIDYVTIASAGDAAVFGNLIGGTTNNPSACSSPVRAVCAIDFGGGAYNASELQYVNTFSLSDAQDFGFLSVKRSYVKGCSNGHGGL